MKKNIEKEVDTGFVYSYTCCVLWEILNCLYIMLRLLFEAPLYKTPRTMMLELLFRALKLCRESTWFRVWGS